VASESTESDSDHLDSSRHIGDMLVPKDRYIRSYWPRPLPSRSALPCVSDYLQLSVYFCQDPIRIMPILRTQPTGNAVSFPGSLFDDRGAHKMKVLRLR
jgi:hypothetical protein